MDPPTRPLIYPLTNPHSQQINRKPFQIQIGYGVAVTSVTLINLSTSPARGSTPRIRVIFCIFRLYLLLLLCLFINLLSFFSTFVIRFILAGARVFIWLSCGDGLSGLSYLDHLSPFCPRLFYLIITLSDQRKQKIGPKGFSSVNHSSHIR